MVLAERFVSSLKQYIDALLLAGSLQPSDWEESRKKLTQLGPFFVFNEDPALVRRFREGDDAARRELARRGQILHAITVFSQGYDRDKWEQARKTLVEAGEPGKVLLAVTLLQLLLNGQNQSVWIHLRYQLVAAGPVSLETAIGLSERLIQDMPKDTPIFKIDDLTQVLLVICGFGDAGVPYLEKLGRHEKPNVRRTVARTLGEALEASSVGVLVALLADEKEWTVRAAAAESMGRMTPARARAGAALVDRVGRERDMLVLRMVVSSIGLLGYYAGIPVLMRALDVPNREVIEAAMLSLVQITGERLARKELWLEWHRTQYAEWLKRRKVTR